MASPRPPIGFSSIELTKDFIGVGSYGIVYKALCNQHLECAAKVVHPVLITDEDGKPEHLHRLPLQRFLQEIDFLSSIRHPNIIGYLGTSWDPNKLPVLLMELMDENLTQFLVRAQKPLPFRIEVNISQDIALALSFLHSNNIVHRDLSSNNVLMLGDRRAKVTDFGMATIFENEQVCSATKVPGATVYMPPEVKRLYPISCDKIDCFSFGVLCVQIMTRKHPKPEDKPPGIFSLLVFDHEISCRQNHISTISKTHPLLPIALNCLKDRYKSRPTSSDICTMLGGLKTVNYEHIDVDKTTPLNKSSENTPLLTTPLPSSCKQKPKQSEAEKVGACLKKEAGFSQLGDMFCQLDDMLMELDGLEGERYNLGEEDDMLVKSEEQDDFGGDHQKHCQNKHKASHSDIKKENATHRRERNLKAEPVEDSEDDLEWVELTDEETYPIQSTTPKTKPVLDMSQDFNTRWSLKSTEAPQHIFRTADAAYLNDDGCVYMLCGPERRTVYSFHPVKYEWIQLQDTMLRLSSLAVVGAFVVTVGGSNGFYCSNKLYSHVGSHWKEKLAPMPTRRYNAIVAMSGSHLIVAGGVSRNKTILTLVEVLDMNNGQWSTVASLPEPSASFSGHISSGKVWVLGYSNAVFSCRLDRLIESGSRATFSFTTRTVFMPVWSYDAMPVHSTTLISMDDTLYAIGGKLHDTNKTTNAVYQYNSWNRCWSIVSHMTAVRSQCLAVSIPRKRMMVVVGGISEKGTPIKLVEMSRLLPTMDRH